MKTIQKLLDEQARLLDELPTLEVKVTKQKQAIDGIAEQIAKLKEQQDYSSLKFVHANIPLIIQKIAPKHRIPPPREINLVSSADTPMIATVPWASEECTDECPCNINVCPRCSLLHFKNLLDRLLAGYYSK